MDQEKLSHGPVQARIVEIDEDGHSVSFLHGDIVVAGDEGEIARVPIIEIAALVVARPGLTVSASALAALSERCAAIVICDASHRSRMLSWPMSGHRWPPLIRAQMTLDGPLGRHLRRCLTAARDEQREAAIQAMGKAAALKALRKNARPVTGGRGGRGRQQFDFESQMRRHYWTWLAGPRFRRNPASADANRIVNLAHTLLRVEAVRAIHRAGLHPSVGLGGAQRRGGLVDEMMLPYRPVVDLAAALLVATGEKKVTARVRAALGGLFSAPIKSRKGLMQISNGLDELAQSLGRCFETGDPHLEIRLPSVQDPAALYDRMMGAAGMAEAASD